MGNPEVKRNISAVVLFSGGLDSTVLLHLMNLGEYYKPIRPLTFAYGSRHETQEMVAVDKILQKYDLLGTFLAIPPIFKGALVGDGEITDTASSIVPFRNGVMLSMAAAWADANEYETLWIAAHKTDNPYPDCRPAFLHAMKDAIYCGTDSHVLLRYPFLGMTKGTLLAEGDLVGAPLGMTWSCYIGGEKHCGVCPACVERRKAFEEAHVYDATEYLD
jgi:7-cyano-7-deazaguanine synthase